MPCSLLRQLGYLAQEIRCFPPPPHGRFGFIGTAGTSYSKLNLALGVLLVKEGQGDDRVKVVRYSAVIDIVLRPAQHEREILGDLRVW
jgi:hypothetical protein